MSRHLCTDYELCPVCSLCGGCCACSLDALADAIVAEALARAEPCGDRDGPCTNPGLHVLYALTNLERIIGVVPQGEGAVLSVRPAIMDNREEQ